MKRGLTWFTAEPWAPWALLAQRGRGVCGLRAVSAAKDTDGSSELSAGAAVMAQEALDRPQWVQQDVHPKACPSPPALELGRDGATFFGSIVGDLTRGCAVTGWSL